MKWIGHFIYCFSFFLDISKFSPRSVEFEIPTLARFYYNYLTTTLSSLFIFLVQVHFWFNPLLHGNTLSVLELKVKHLSVFWTRISFSCKINQTFFFKSINSIYDLFTIHTCTTRLNLLAATIIIHFKCCFVLIKLISNKNINCSWGD